MKKLTRGRMALILILIVCVSCATTKIPAATGGSKADATVVMGYQYGGFERPVVDWDDAAEKATQICQNWGYDYADTFGGIMRECNAFNAYGCTGYLVTVQYQCIDNKEKSDRNE